MPRSIRNPKGLTIRQLIQNTYFHKKSRVDNRDRDVIRRIKVEKHNYYDLSANRKRTTFVIKSFSYPQYYPYYTKTDSRGRKRSYQRSHRHQYDVTIQLDELSIDTTAIRLRTGSQKMWDKNAKVQKNKKGKVIKESKNVLNGINADFLFRLEYVYAKNGILYGRDRTKGRAPKITNKNEIIFLDKHMLSVLEILIDKHILK